MLLNYRCPRQTVLSGRRAVVYGRRRAARRIRGQSPPETERSQHERPNLNTSHGTWASSASRIIICQVMGVYGVLANQHRTMGQAHHYGLYHDLDRDLVPSALDFYFTFLPLAYHLLTTYC